MKEHPILFSAPMVRAILESRKTMTRRVVKYPAKEGESGWHPCPEGFQYLPGGSARPVCPYGQPGDRLWVRETWATSKYFDKDSPSCTKDHGLPFWYQADDVVVYTGASSGGPAFMTRGKWRPSIHMPRWASRILLELTAISVERVQDISPKDIMAEGIHAGTVNGQPQYTNRYWVENVTADFRCLWNEINAKRGYGWDSNPYVWVLTFKVNNG